MLSAPRLVLLGKNRQRSGRVTYRPRHSVRKSSAPTYPEPKRVSPKPVKSPSVAHDNIDNRQSAHLDTLGAPTLPIPAIPTAAAHHRILTLFKDRALTGAFALMFSAVMAGVLGFVFWAVTARRQNASALGSASAEVSAIAFLAMVSSSNLTSIFARFLPVAGWQARRLILTCYAGVSLASLVATIIFFMTPLAKGLVIGGAAGRLAFTLCVIVSSVFNIQDGGLIGFGRFELVPVENILVALLRLALLPIAVILFAVQDGILFSWALPMAIAVSIVNVFVVGRLAGRQAKQAPNLPPYRELGRLIAVDSVPTAVYSATGTFLPALVTREFGATEGGYFYVPWIIASMIIVLLSNIAASMVREAIASPKKASSTIHRSIRLGLLVVVVVMAGCLLMSNFVLAPMGSAFADNGAPLLRWIGLATPATAIIVLFWTSCLIQQRPWPAFFINLTTSAAMLASVLELGRGGKIGHIGMIYCIVQWGAATVVAIPTARALRAVQHGTGYRVHERRIRTNG